MFAHTETTDNFIFLHLNLSHLSYPSDMTFHPKNTPMFYDGKANRSLGTPQWVKLPGFLKLAASRTGLLGGGQSPVCLGTPGNGSGGKTENNDRHTP